MHICILSPWQQHLESRVNVGRTCSHTRRDCLHEFYIPGYSCQESSQMEEAASASTTLIPMALRAPPPSGAEERGCIKEKAYGAAGCDDAHGDAGCECGSGEKQQWWCWWREAAPTVVSK